MCMCFMLYICIKTLIFDTILPVIFFVCFSVKIIFLLYSVEELNFRTISFYDSHGN